MVNLILVSNSLILYRQTRRKAAAQNRGPKVKAMAAGLQENIPMQPGRFLDTHYVNNPHLTANVV